MVKPLRYLLLLFPVLVCAQESFNVAVTASFKPVLEQLAEPFQTRTGYRLNLSSASTGVLYQQILSGAPFDIFFAADSERPRLLVEQLNLPATARRNYARGQLVMVVNNGVVTSVDGLRDYTGRIIMANPAHAPYGQAAQQLLDAVAFNGDRVLASNVTQARQYLSLGLADVGLIAASVAHGFATIVEIEATGYDAIEQQVIILKPSAKTDALVEFLQSPFAQHVIQQQGYLLPEPE